MELQIALKELACQLRIGQMVPVRTEMSFDGSQEPFLSFMVKENDELIAALNEKPDIEISYGFVTFDYEEKVFILFMFLRINNQDDLTYETAFSLAEPSVLDDCKVFSEQSGIQVILVGEREYNSIRVKIDLLHHNVAAIIKLASEKSNLDWSMETFMDSLGFIKSQTTSPAELYHYFKRSGGFLEVRAK